MSRNFSIKTTPKTREVLISIENASDIHKKHMRQALHEIGQEVKREIVRLIKYPPKTGRVYVFRGQSHQASAPGEAPANRSGRLMKSASYRTRNHQEMEVGLKAEYAEFLESGTRKMRPRPFLTRAVESKHRDAVLILESAIKK